MNVIFWLIVSFMAGTFFGIFIATLMVAAGEESRRRDDEEDL